MRLRCVQAQVPQAVQPHLRKCFEAIARLEFAEDLQISSMESPEGEVMPFDKPMYPEVRLRPAAAQASAHACAISLPAAACTLGEHRMHAAQAPADPPQAQCSG